MATRVPRRSTATRGQRRLPSDRASVRAEGSGRVHQARDTSVQRHTPLPAETYAAAARKLRTWGDLDVLEMLGLSEVA